MAKQQHWINALFPYLVLGLIIWGVYYESQHDYVHIKDFMDKIGLKGGSGGGTPWVPYPKDVPPNTEYLTYNAQISLVPNNICSGGATTGTITSNIYNGLCSIFVDAGGGYVFFANVNLDNAGRFSQIARVDPLGTATFIAVCCDASRNCKLTNTQQLTVRTCDTDGDGIPDETDADDDNDGYSDEDEMEAGTDPKDDESYPTKDCTQNDGGDNKDVPGYAFDGIYWYDLCINANTIREYYCSGGKAVNKIEDCDVNEECFTTRSGGYCKPKAGSPDSDGDGYTDAEEAAADTNPNDPYSHPTGPNDIMCANFCIDQTAVWHNSIYKPGWNNLYCSSVASDLCAKTGRVATDGNYFGENGCCCWDCSGD